MSMSMTDIGAVAPTSGFVDKEAFRSVVDTMGLPDGLSRLTRDLKSVHTALKRKDREILGVEEGNGRNSRNSSIFDPHAA